MPIAVDQPAPDFTLYAAPGEPISLSDYRGKKVALFFLPAVFTGVCTKEVCDLRDNISGFADLGADVIAITVDGVHANMKFRELNDANFPILSDWNREATEAYQVKWENFAGIEGFHVANRSAFVIGEDGRILYAWAGEHPGTYPDMDAIRAVIRGEG